MEDILNLNIDFSDKKQTLLFTVVVQVFKTIAVLFIHMCNIAFSVASVLFSKSDSLLPLYPSFTLGQAFLCLPFSICAFLVASTANAGISAVLLLSILNNPSIYFPVSTTTRFQCSTDSSHKFSICRGGVSCFTEQHECCRRRLSYRLLVYGYSTFIDDCGILGTTIKM